VAIGASAGGVKALQTLFGRIPPDTGASYIVIVHLDPEHESHLPEIIGACTRMSVTTVSEPATLQPNCVYVIPPGRQLRVTDDVIATAEFSEPRGRRAPIDMFFRSFADQHGDGFAVVLTGAGADGSVGVKAVKEAGGIVLVQEPTEAEFSSMPNSAIATGAADMVLAIPELADELVRMIKQKKHVQQQVLADHDEEMLRQILNYLRARTGHDFLKYKRSTVLRRIARRMQVAHADDLESYMQYLREYGQEVEWLFADLLISVTTFFRDPEAFQRLGGLVIPRLFENKDASDTVRVWVPGCATGEEAYSLAILLLEEAARQECKAEIQIFASDLDNAALSIAREAVYPLSIETDVTEQRLRRFFSREGQYYRIRREVRELVLFANHSLLKDPPFSRIDLVSCRNVLIYLDRDLQLQVISTFNYALVSGGYLFLGSSEGADAPQGLFRQLDRETRIYQSIGRVGDRVPHLTRMPIPQRAPDLPVPRAAARPAHNEGALHRQALEELAPPSILVDEMYRILHVSETAGRYLLYPGGPAVTDLTELVRPELRMDLRSALHRAMEQGHTSLSLPIPVRFNGKAQRIYMQVKPVLGQDGLRSALVIFIEGGIMENISDDAAVIEEGRSVNDTIQQLREELKTTRARLKASREEEESANEELRAANEELQSINEEYRSTAEELETSKEELQSINEELQTLNNELKLKLESVSRAHNDLQNLMAATEVGTLFLDGELRIKLLTPRVADLFNITTSDEGRPITDFTHALDYSLLAADARAVLKTLAPVEREAQSADGAWFLIRLRPYRTVEDKIEGVVVTFVDMTERRRTEGALRDSEARLKLAREAADLGIQDFDPRTQECWWDERARQLWGIQADDVVTMELVWSRVVEEDRAAAKEAFEQALDPEGDGVYAAEFRVHNDKPSTCWIKANGKAAFAGQGQNRKAVRMVATVQDISERKEWEAHQRILLNELSHRVKNTLAVVISIARKTFHRTDDPVQALPSFEGRLLALANAHDLLVEHDWQGADLEALIKLQLGPYEERIVTDGPPIMLPASLATPLGLVLHELATNAAKYGAFSNGEGRVLLTWRLLRAAKGRALEVTWREEDGPATGDPGDDGLGRRLMERTLPGAEVEWDLRPDGLKCVFTLDLDPAHPGH
jgi:two-component system CheB/CheR fusion protein